MIFRNVFLLIASCLTNKSLEPIQIHVDWIVQIFFSAPWHKIIFKSFVMEVLYYSTLHIGLGEAKGNDNLYS